MAGKPDAIFNNVFIPFTAIASDGYSYAIV
jgi:hypothetical protein